MFDFFVPGAIVAAFGVALPVAGRAEAASGAHVGFRRHDRRGCSAPCCTSAKAASQTANRLAEVLKKTDGRMKITRIERGENLTLARLPVSVLRAGDRIYVSDTPENLKEFETLLETTLYDGDDKAPVDRRASARAAQTAARPDRRHRQFAARATHAQPGGFSYRYDLLPLALHRSRRHAQTTYAHRRGGTARRETSSSSRARTRRSRGSRTAASSSCSMPPPTCRTRARRRSLW